MIKLNQLISHRFRGFSHHENTIKGLVSALDFGVQVLEFDIRVAKCGTPVIYHDEYAFDKSGNKLSLCDYMFRDYAKLGGTFLHMPTADDLFRAAAKHANKATLLIDIKDFGFEMEIDALVRTHGLQNRVVYVSWLADVVYQMSEIAPDISLCFSHWCQEPNSVIRSLHKVYESTHGNVSRSENTLIHGERSGWFVNSGITGEMLELLKSSNGYICVPQEMISKELSNYYLENGIQVSTFSYVNNQQIEEHKEQYNIDLFFVDDRKVFDNLS